MIDDRKKIILLKIVIIALCFFIAFICRMFAAVWSNTYGIGAVADWLRIVSWSGYAVAILIMVTLIIEKLRSSQKG